MKESSLGEGGEGGDPLPPCEIGLSSKNGIKKKNTRQCYLFVETYLQLVYIVLKLKNYHGSNYQQNCFIWATCMHVYEYPMVITLDQNREFTCGDILEYTVFSSNFNRFITKTWTDHSFSPDENSYVWGVKIYGCDLNQPYCWKMNNECNDIKVCSINFEPTAESP